MGKRIIKYEPPINRTKENPITIIGAGAGAEVTARCVFGDLLRIADKK